MYFLSNMCFHPSDSALQDIHSSLLPPGSGPDLDFWDLGHYPPILLYDVIADHF